LLRFLVTPNPDVDIAIAGAANIGVRMMSALIDLADMLGASVRPGSVPADGPFEDWELKNKVEMRLAYHFGTPPPPPGFAFSGPTSGSTVDFELLAQGCWALALLTEVFHYGEAALKRGPLSQFASAGPSSPTPDVTVADLLALAPPAAIEELTAFRKVLKASLLPRLARRSGPWTIGPTFDGTDLVGGADADLIAAGLLVELKTTLGKKRGDGSRVCILDKRVLFQVVGYALLDSGDQYHLDEIALFNARYAYLASWPLDALVLEMSGGTLDKSAARREFEPVVRALRGQAEELQRSRIQDEPPNAARSS
jgi:hypothetical protein